jgi:hypothetical protein
MKPLAPHFPHATFPHPHGRRCTRPLHGLLALAAALLWTAQPALADFVQQGNKLVGTGTIGDQAQVRQGTAVAVSADGNTLIVGGMPQNSSDGATWVFTRTGGVWTQQGPELIGTGGGNSQGRSVALSADGNTALVGGPGNGGNGGAWVFTRSGGVWTQQGAKLVGSGGVGSTFLGTAVALSADGNTALVGGNGDSSFAGAAWVFTRSGGVWTQQGGKLVGSGATGNAFQGAAVALSGDGNTAIVGGLQDSGAAGAAWVFARSGGVWTQQGSKLVGTGTTGGVAAQQGRSVALSADGNTAIVGGNNDGTQVGAAWVYTRSGGVWTQQGSKLVGTGFVGTSLQGFSVELSPSGNMAILGGRGDDPSGSVATGAVWVFTRSGGVWTQQGNKLFGSGASNKANQGSSTALSCNTLVTGGPSDRSFGGATWVFAASTSNAPRTVTHDFGGDCLSDIVWRDSGGNVVVWMMAGSTAINGGSPGSAATNWSIVGQRDFDGDGLTDLLWRNTGGQLVIWFMNGSTVLGGGSPGTGGIAWTLAGTGDFNGDGKDDVLWVSATGQAVVWLLDGTTVIGMGTPGSMTTDWSVAGTGDFNGDGFTDVLWRNSTTGQVVNWLMNGTSIIGGGVIGSAASNWVIAGTGDFNADNRSDILWRDSNTGGIVIWLIDGSAVIGAGSPSPQVPPDWAIAQTGDYDSDGKSDILWRNTTTGQVVTWFMDGLAPSGGGSPGSATTDWQIQGVNAD